MDSSKPGRMTPWVPVERFFNAAIIIAALVLVGALAKRYFLNRSSAPQQAAAAAPEVVGRQETDKAAASGASASTAAGPAKTVANKPKAAIDESANFVDERQVRNALRAGQHLVVLDVRERSDFATKHFSRAKNIPVDEIEVRAVNELSPADLIVLFCGCKNDGMSLVAKKILGLQGFTRITFLHDGTESCGYCG